MESVKNFLWTEKSEFPKLVYVEWLDHCGSAESGWEHMTHAQERVAEHVWSVGWVMAEDEDVINIIPHMSKCNYASGAMTILKCCVVKAVQLKDPRDWESK